VNKITNKKLNVMERLTLLGVLPKEGNFASLRIIRKLQERLSFTEEELKEFEVDSNEETGTVNWNPKGNEEKEVEVGEKACEIIKAKLKQLNDEKKLTQQHVSVYEKFMLDEKEEDAE